MILNIDFSAKMRDVNRSTNTKNSYFGRAPADIPAYIMYMPMMDTWYFRITACAPINYVLVHALPANVRM